MALVCGAAGWAATIPDPSVTVTNYGTGFASPGATITATDGSGNWATTATTGAIFTLTFDRDVVPGALYTGVASTIPALTASGTGAVFNWADFTGTDIASPVYGIRQVNARTFQVAVSPFADGKKAVLTLPAGLVKANAGADSNAAVTYTVVCRATSGSGAITLTTPDYEGDPNGTVAGTVATPTVGGYVVSLAHTPAIPSSATVTEQFKASANSWSHYPDAVIPIGMHTFVVTATDLAGNAITAGAATTIHRYVWDSPTLTQLEQSPAGLRPYTGNSAVTMKTNMAKPAMTGKVGLPNTTNALGSGNSVQLKVDIQDTTAQHNAVINTMIATITANGDTNSADWSISAADYGTQSLDTSAGVHNYQVVLTLKVVGTNASTNTITSTQLISVDNIAAATVTKPVLTTSGSGATIYNLRPAIAITVGGSAPTPCNATNIHIWDTLTPPGGSAGTNTDITATGTFGDGAVGHDALGVWRPNSDWAHGSHSITATYTDVAGNMSQPSASALVISDYVALASRVKPTLTIVGSNPNPNYDHRPGVTVALAAVPGVASPVIDGTTVVMYDTYTNLAGTVSANAPITGVFGDGAVGHDAVGVWRPSAQLAEGTHVLTATWQDPAGQVSDPTASALTLNTRTPKPTLSGGVASTAVGVSVANTNQQFVTATRRPAITIAGLPTGNTGTLTVWGLSRGTTGIVIDPTVTTTAGLHANNVIAGTLSASNTVWTPDNALTDLTAYSLVARWTDNDASNHSTVATAGTSSGTIDSVVSNVFNIRVIKQVDPPVITGIFKTDGTTQVLNAVTNKTGSINVNEVIVKGTGNVGATLTLYNKGIPGPTIVVGDDSNWSYTYATIFSPANSPALASGLNSLAAKQLDLCNTSSVINPQAINVTVDSHTPPAPVIQKPTNNQTMALTTPVVSGTAEANSTVKLYDGGTLLTTVPATITTTAAGTWSATLGSALTSSASPGTAHSLTAVATSSASVVGAASAAVVINIVDPGIYVKLEPITTGTGTGYYTSGAAGGIALNATTIPVSTSSPYAGTGTILAGDEITFAGDANKYYVSAFSSPNITLSFGLKVAIPANTKRAISIWQPVSPVSAGNGNTTACSASSIVLRATFTNGTAGGAAVTDVTTAQFNSSKFQLGATGGVISSIVQGAGLTGGPGRNVWTITVNTPTSGLLSVGIPAGGFQNTPTTGTGSFNKVSQTAASGSTFTTAYTLNMNRIKPTITWQGAAGTTNLFPAVSAGTARTGNSYVKVGSPVTATTYTVRAHFSVPMSRNLAATDLTIVGAQTSPAPVITPVGGGTQDFDIALIRGSSTATTMSVTVKAMPTLTDLSSPAQSNVASVPFVATVVPTPVGPVIASAVGSAAPLKPAKTSSYPCSVTFTAPVTGFTAKNLTVTNGVVTNFAGAGSAYTFLLTPGEGQVSVVYDPAVNPAVYDVAGTLVPASNTLVRVLDSRQPTIVQVSSAFFDKMGGGATASVVLNGAVVKTTQETSAGAGDGWAISNPGSGYNVAPAVTLVSVGSGATATATLSGGGIATGTTSITVNNGGSGYTVAPNVIITDAGGTPTQVALATATINASGVVTGITVGTAGIGYTTPVVTITSGSGATATATISTTTGKVTGLTITNAGANYTTAPRVVFYSCKPLNSPGPTIFPVRVTFNEPVAAFPSNAVVASASGTTISIQTPVVVAGTGGTTYTLNLQVPPSTDGPHVIKLVVPSLGLTDGALNSSAASGVYSFTYDLVDGTPVEAGATAVYSNG